MKTKMVEILERGKFDLVRVDELVTVDDDPSLRRALARCVESGVDVVVAVQPTSSDGRLAPVLAQQWGPATVLWASPEMQEGQRLD